MFASIRFRNGFQMSFAFTALLMVVTAFADVNIMENMELEEDADWRGRGPVTIAAGVTLDLNGHDLMVNGLNCQGSIIPSPPPGYKFYRFKVDALANGTNLQISEIKLFSGEQDVTSQHSAVLWREDNYTTGYIPTYIPPVAFDGKTGTKWFDDRPLDDVWVTLEFPQPIYVTHYQWFNGNDTGSQQGRRPTAWRFQGSNDNATWVDLDVVVNANPTTTNYALAYTGTVGKINGLIIDVTGGQTYALSGSCTAPVYVQSCRLSADVDLRCFGELLNITGNIDLAGHKMTVSALAGSGTVFSQEAAGAPPSYKFFRFKVDATKGGPLQISEVKLFSGDQDISRSYQTFHWNQETHPPQYLANYSPLKAVDNNLGTKWFDDERPTTDFWFTLEYAQPMQVTSYQWYTGDDTSSSQNRNPASWCLMGSNDNVNWTDLDGRVNVTPTVANMTMAYTGYIMVGDGSELRVDVPAGQTRTHSGVTLDKCVKFVKTGAGTLIAAQGGNNHHGGTVVEEGILKPGVRSDTSLFGAVGSTITIASGAQFLDDIHCYGSTAGLNWIIAGEGPDGTGAIKAPTYFADNRLVAWGRGLALADDALIRRDVYAFDFESPGFNPFRMALNGHTLTLKAAQYSQWFLVCSVMATGEGTLVIDDNINFAPYRELPSQFPNTTIIVGPGACYNTGNGETDVATRALTVSNFIYRSTSTISQKREPTYVLGRYAPASVDSAPYVVLGDAEHLKVTLDLSERTTPFDVTFGGGLSFADNALVQVELGTRRCHQGDCLVAWTERPSAKFVSTAPMTHFETRADGLYISPGTLVYIR